MRIDAGQMIAGRPAAEIRELLRKALFGAGGLSLAREVLGAGAKKARDVLTALEREGYIERVEGRGEWLWDLTVKGRVLAHATAAKPVPRASAEMRLAEFLERVREVNADDYYLYRVRRVLLFGSLLAGQGPVNDVDVAVEFEPKEADRERQEELERRRRHEAREAGRRFSNIVESLQWPQYEVWLRLKARSRTISLHLSLEVERLQCPHRVVYEYDPGAEG